MTTTNEKSELKEKTLKEMEEDWLNTLKKERMKAIKSVIYNRLREPQKYTTEQSELEKWKTLANEIFNDEKVHEEFDKYLDTAMDSAAEELAMLEILMVESWRETMRASDREMDDLCVKKKKVRYGPRNK